MADQPTSGDAAGATEQPVPLDDEAKTLKLAQTKAESKKAIAEAEKAEVEAQKATLAAQLPTSDAKPLEGKIELGEKAGLVADLLAHSLVREGARAIVADVNGKLDASSIVLIVEDRNLTSLDWPYEAIKRQLDKQSASLEAAYELVNQVKDFVAERVEETVPSPPQEVVPGAFVAPAVLSALISAAPAAVGAITNLVGMFRSDYSITNREVAIGTTPLVAAVTGELLKKDDDRHCGKVVNRAFELVAGSELASCFWVAWGKRVELERDKTILKARVLDPADQTIESLRAQWTATQSSLDTLLATKDGASPAALQAEIRRLRKAVNDEQNAVAPVRGPLAAAESAISRFNEFAVAVTATAESAPYPPLVAAAIQERLRAGTSKVTHVLYVGLEADGAEAIRRRHLLLGSRLSFLGGVQVSHLLLDVGARATTAGGTESFLGRIRYELSDDSVSERTVTNLADGSASGSSSLSLQRVVLLAAAVGAAIAVFAVAVLEAST